MRQIDIKSEHADIVKKILKVYLPANTKVWVFGSRVQGNAKKFSDLDLAIEANTKLDSSILTQVKFDLEESDLPYKVDVVDWNAISENFKNLIAEDIVLFWQN